MIRKKGKKAAGSKRVARKRPARVRKASSAARLRPSWQRSRDSDDMRRAIDEGMQDLRIKTQG
jgi:hypothetical protein